MSKDGSVAPRERVNIVYKSANNGAVEEVELPLKILMMGDFTGKPDGRALEERAPINVDKSNFNDVMAQQGLELTLSTPNKLSEEAGAMLPASLRFRSLADFTPEGVAGQVPELKALLALRAGLTALKGPMANVQEFRKLIQKLLADTGARQQLMSELGLAKSDEKP